MTIVRLLSRLVLLLEENNDLLRELHLRTTGHSPLVPRRRNSGWYPPTAPPPREGSRVRSGTDVWQRTPPSATASQQSALHSREAAASQPSGNSSDRSESDTEPSNTPQEKFAPDTPPLVPLPK